MVGERRAVTSPSLPPQAATARSDTTRKVRDNRPMGVERTDHSAPVKTLGIAALITLISVTASSQSATSIRSLAFVSGLQSPVAFVPDPTDRAVFYAVEQAGRIRIIRNRAIAGDLLDFRGAITAAANGACSVWRSLRILQRPDASSSISRISTATRSWPDSARSPGAAPTSRAGSICGSTARCLLQR